MLEAMNPCVVISQTVWLGQELHQLVVLGSYLVHLASDLDISDQPQLGSILKPGSNRALICND